MRKIGAFVLCVFASGCCATRFGMEFWVPRSMSPPMIREQPSENPVERLEQIPLPAPQIREGKREEPPRIDFSEWPIA